jgi:NAD(P)-dependent dehydrogenase (short-subunit alcohol dehydrogenase family)
MFENQRLLVTGGTSGIGLATAIAFAEAGVRRIGLIGRNVERGTEAERQVAARGAAVRFIQADANYVDQARRAGEEAINHLGSIDVLVNSTAGLFKPELFHAIPLNDIPEIVTQQLMAPLLMCGVVLPSMRAQKSGLIINIASDAAKVATPGESVIGAVMAAIVMFSRTLAMEAKRDGVRVNALTPSLVDGTATAERILADGFSQKLFQKAAKQAHLGVARPEDLAAIAVFLAGPGGSKITGQAISVNGGISAA